MSGREAQAETLRSPERAEEKPSRESAGGAPEIALARLALPLGSPGGPNPVLRRAVSRPGLAAPALLQLQRQVGNRQVQRMVALARESSGGEITPEVEQSISRARGSGRPLDSEVRGRMEASFGTDFGGVRVHTGAEADRLNRRLSARAFTTGSDVFFRDGEYRPGSSAGRELIAHELTHVVQQQGTVQASRLTLGPPGDRFEQEADSVARQVMRDEAVPVALGASGAARSVQRRPKPGPDDPQPLVVPAGTFDQAAETFANALRQRNNVGPNIGIVVVNGMGIRVYNLQAQRVGGSFRLIVRQKLGSGVFGMLPGSPDRLLHQVTHKDGVWELSQRGSGGEVDFAKDVEPRGEFAKVAGQFSYLYYVVPEPRPGVVPDEELPLAPPEETPDFMKFQPEGKADLPAYPAAVVALTPQLTAVGTTGKFYCRLDKVLWTSTIDNVAALLERANFKWEVLKLDSNLLVTDKERATRWDATKERFRTKARHIREDEETMRRGDGRASVPEKLYREHLTAQMAQPRRILGYTGEAVLTLMHSLVGGKDPNVEDYIDYTFKEPGDYFVRCLVTPVMGSKATRRRATSVAGVLISVQDMKAVADTAVHTPEELLENAAERLEEHEGKLAKLLEKREAADSPEKKAEIDLEIGLLKPRRAYLEAVQRAGGDAHGVLAADLELARARLAFVTGKEAPAFKYTPNQVLLRRLVEKFKQDEARFAGQLERADSKLGDLVRRTGFMRAVLLDDVTGAQQEVLLSIGERRYVATDRLEVVIADVTSKKGRRFTGMGSGLNARSDAWTGAMRDLQRHLGRGRGWLSFQAPPPYGSMMQGLDSPMQLQVAELDQIKDVVDDALNAATIAALLAAPFTGGASLGFLAVLMPIQFGSSLYNIVNRAMYDDLELDADAVFSLLDIASFGVAAKVGAIGRAARRSVGMMSANGRIALGLLDGGGYVMISYTTYSEMMRDDPEETPEQARVRKLRALLGLFQTASIPIANKLFTRAGMNPDGSIPGEAPSPRDRTSADAASPDKPGPDTAPAKPASRPGDGPDGAPDVPKAYLDALQGVAKKVPPRINPGLQPGTVRIEYRQKDGVITGMWMEIAPGTPAARVKQHAPTARDMARFRGLSGRVRKVYQQIVQWLSKNPQAGPGSRAWEARLELAKLQRIVDERFAAYDRAVAEGNAALRDELSRELDHLEAQLIAHARDVDGFETGGRGFVAAEGTGGTFSPETSRSEAFRELGGFEARVEGGRREATSDLGRFVDAAVGEKVATGPDDFIKQMPDPRGLSPEAVLRQTKQPFLAKLAERVTDAKRLRNLASYRAARAAGDSPAEALYRASHAEGTRVLDLLPEADRAAFAEAWSARSAAIPAPAARRGEILPETLTGVPAPPRPIPDPAQVRERLEDNPAGLPALDPARLGKPPEPAPARMTLDELLVDGRFTDAELEKAYQAYEEGQEKKGDPAASREEWVKLTRGAARERLELLLGPDFSFGGGGTGVERQLPLVDFARPAAYTQPRLDADLATVERDPGKLWERLGRLQTDGVTGGVVGESLFNILKGNAAEILSRPIQAAELAKVQQRHPGARLYDDVRARIWVKKDGKVRLSDWVLFTDNVVATRRGQSLDLHAVFEVKAGSEGGQDATTQVFDWIEAKLDEKIEIRVGGDTYVYDPGSAAPNQVINLARADRHIIAARGAEHLGLQSGDQIARPPKRHALPHTADEIDFLTRSLIEKHILQKEGPVPPPPAPAPTPAPAPAPATTPAALPEPARRPGSRDVVSPLEMAQEEYLSSPHALSPEEAHWVLSGTHAYLEAAAMISEWTPATNAVGAEVFKSLTRITALPPHVEGFVVYGRRKGKKVTIITGYHGSSEGLTVPEKKFAVDDAKYYGEKYPDVDVIDTSEMTHDQRVALIEAIPGVVIVSTCFAASATPSAPAPGQPRGGHAASFFLPNTGMFNRLIEGIDTRPQASHGVRIEHHRMPSPEQMPASRGRQYGLIESVRGVNIRRVMSGPGLEDVRPGNVLPGLEGMEQEALHAVERSKDIRPGSSIVEEAERLVVRKGDVWFSPSRALAEQFANDFEGLIRAVKRVVDSWQQPAGAP